MTQARNVPLTHGHANECLPDWTFSARAKPDQTVFNHTTVMIPSCTNTVIRLARRVANK
jgi:hypothetical protein